MRPTPRLTTAILLLATLATRAAQPATPTNPPPKRKTQSVAIRLPDEPGPKIDLVQLPPGKITLKGADGKDREHAIKPIWIAKYETRWDEYDVFWRALDLPERERRESLNERMRTRTRMPYMPPDGGYDPDNWQAWESPGHDNFPANCIHFQAAQRYCTWLSKHTGKKFRLPTEAEWEYACRAGGPPLEPDPQALDKLAWFAANSGDKPHLVGKKQPNPWGLYDMLGNVGEFVIRNPKDDKGLLAGGSYKDDAKAVHSAAREPYSPAWQRHDPVYPKDTNWLFWSVHHVGFRVVMED